MILGCASSTRTAQQYQRGGPPVSNASAFRLSACGRFSPFRHFRFSVFRRHATDPEGIDKSTRGRGPTPLTPARIARCFDDDAHRGSRLSSTAPNKPLFGATMVNLSVPA